MNLADKGERQVHGVTDEEVGPSRTSGIARPHHQGPCTTVVWFRRDLRVEDNPALIAACRSGYVIPVFIWSPEEEGQFYPGRVSRWWTTQSLIHLDASLRALGSLLVMRRATNSFSALLQIIHATKATHLFFNHLYDPVSLVRDHKVKQSISELGVTVHTFNADLLYEPWEVYEDDGQPFTTFSQFWTRWQDMPFQPDNPLSTPNRLVLPPVELQSMRVDELGLEERQEKSSNALLARAWTPGWANADRSLLVFIQGPLQRYSSSKNKADSMTTSLLSPHLHFGEISVRKVYHQVRRMQAQWKSQGAEGASQGVDAFVRSLGLREYSRYLSFNFPFTHERSLLSNLKSFPWRLDEAGFKAWRQGRTGFPLIDAAMRELWATGWLHNRLRITVSSFSVKLLLLPWRWGMKYFWDTLLDADLESDVLGWQYISGSLPDGHELDRMEDPEVEGYKYDPEGEYVRRWLPELCRLPTEYIHHPWDAPPDVLKAAGVELGSNYPLPIVDVSTARDRLQEALSYMWEREAALKAVMVNGVQEGAGESSVRVRPQSFGQISRQSEGQWSGVVGRAELARSGSGAGGSRSWSGERRDQLVPSMAMPSVSEGTIQAAGSILRMGQSTTDMYSVGLKEEGSEDGMSERERDDAQSVQIPVPTPGQGSHGHGHRGVGSAAEMAAQRQAREREQSPDKGAPTEQPNKRLTVADGRQQVEDMYSPFAKNIPYLLAGPRRNDDVDSTAESSTPHGRLGAVLPVPDAAGPSEAALVGRSSQQGASRADLRKPQQQQQGLLQSPVKMDRGSEQANEMDAEEAGRNVDGGREVGQVAGNGEELEELGSGAVAFRRHGRSQDGSQELLFSEDPLLKRVKRKPGDSTKMRIPRASTSE